MNEDEDENEDQLPVKMWICSDKIVHVFRMQQNLNFIRQLDKELDELVIWSFHVLNVAECMEKEGAEIKIEEHV